MNPRLRKNPIFIKIKLLLLKLVRKWNVISCKMVDTRSSTVRSRYFDPLGIIIKEVKEGCLEKLKSLITPDLEPILRRRLSSSRVPANHSLLVTAVQHKQKDILLYLIDDYHGNIEQETSTVIEGGFPVEGATPLWTASTLGHLDMVQELVKRGANIEHTTDSHSSPLRGAAFDGHIDVVEYLIKQGADIDKPNQVGQSPLTIAAAMKQIETAKYLIENGANIHHKGHNGDMPLHVAVESGSDDVTKMLVEAGAKNVPNDVGYTPAVLASCYGHHEILKYLDFTFKLEPKELYDCYCLIVSKEILNGEISEALKWAAKAIEIKQNHSFSDAIVESHPIYNGVQEPATADEARNTINDEVKSFFLCAVYCERILGPVHPTTAFYIRISGDMALEQKMYGKCMQLWLRSLEYDEAARMAYELQIIEDLLFSVRGFAKMIEADYTPQLVQHFDWGIREFKLAKESKISQKDVVYCLCRLLAVWMLAIDSSAENSYKMKEKTIMRRCAKKLYNLMEGKDSPLLVACLQNLQINKTHNHVSAASAIARSKLPLHKVVSLFLDFGCPLNSEDEESGNFLLHMAVNLKEDSSLECVKTLIEAGAHIDAVNQKNQTPFDVALGIGNTSEGYVNNRPSLISYLQSSQKKYGTLKCLCAKVIIKDRLHYRDILPNSLVAFVLEHDSNY